MEERIFGNPDAIKRAKEAHAGDKTVYINWDLIKELPEEFEPVVTEIKIDIKKDFSDIGNGNYMPKPELMYKIAEAAGISGGDKSLYEPIIEEIDINPMLCKSIEDEPLFRKMTVGYRVTKYATRIQEDGTPLRSSPCTCAFHVWNRCLELWEKEEVYTEGYTKKGKYPNKYDSKFKRKSHFASEMKFAQAKAETKSYLKAIRELAGLMTGYRQEDLISGRLSFVKIRRSHGSIKMETAARLAALSQGKQLEAPEPNLLFADEPQQEIKPEPKPELENKPEPTAHRQLFSGDHEPLPATAREMLIKTLNHYLSDGLIGDNNKETAKNIIEWLNNTPEAESDPKFWPKALSILKEIETNIFDEGKIDHKLY